MKKMDIGEKYKTFRIMALVSEEDDDIPSNPKVHIYTAKKMIPSEEIGEVITREIASLSELENVIEGLKDNLDELYKEVEQREILN